MADKPTLEDRAEYALARGVEIGLSALPPGAADRLGRALGAVVHRPLGIRREVVEANLRRAFPDATDDWISATMGAVYQHLGREAVAMLRMSRLDREQILRRTSVTGFERLETALQEGSGAIVVTGHYGNWEIGAAAVAARGLPIIGVAKRQRNRLFDARLNDTRGRLGVETIDMSRAPSRVPRALAAGKVVAMVADQDAGRSGIPVPFFGEPASTFRGPALFALRLGVPLFHSVARREATGGYSAVFERVAVERTGDLDADVSRVTRSLSDLLEKAVRAAPDQYFWFHKRWKTTFPSEPEHGGAGTNSA